MTADPQRKGSTGTSRLAYLVGVALLLLWIPEADDSLLIKGAWVTLLLALVAVAVQVVRGRLRASGLSRAGQPRNESDATR